MDKPIISYHILNADNSYTKQNSVYAGTYTGDEPLEVRLRIWNNYRGIENVEDLQNFNLVLRFLTEEDNALLKYIDLIDEKHNIQIPGTIEENAFVGIFFEPVVLSGSANTGSDEYNGNYIDIKISFKAGANAYLKDHDLKSLVLDIVEL